MARWETDARDAAAAFGVTVLVGVRPKGTWFAHADGLEVDGDGPTGCVRALVEQLKRRAESEASKARREAERHERAMASLAGAVDNARTRR